MNLLTQNSKIKKTSKHFNKKVFNFSIPAYKSETGKVTCPMAGKCIQFCYAQKGFYKLSKIYSEAKLQITMQDNFIELMNKDIKDKKAEYIRVHDSGDYYSKEYLNKWLIIFFKITGINNLDQNPF